MALWPSVLGLWPCACALRWRLRLRLRPGRLRQKNRKLRKSSPGGTKIDPRGGQNASLEASGSLVGTSAIADSISKSSKTGSKRLLGLSWRVLVPSWGGLGASWGHFRPPGAVPGGSREAPGGYFGSCFGEVEDERVKIALFSLFLVVFEGKC